MMNYFDADDLQTLYDALGEAIDALQAEAESASELGITTTADVTIRAYEALRLKLHPLVIGEGA